MTGYPTPTFDNITLTAPLSTSNGGTGQTSAENFASAISATFYTSTIASLRALTSANLTTTCIVANYATAGDQGGGTFVVDASDTTSADNGGTIIVDAAGRRWYRETNGVIRPEYFGVQTDTTGALVAANSAAYNKAIAAASASATSRLYHSAGLTVFLNPIVLTASLFWEIDGTITLAPNSNANIVDIQASNIAIWGNGTFNGNKANQQGGTGTVVGGICSNTNSTSATMPLPPASPISISNILIRGIAITEVFNWPVSLGYVTNGTIDGVTMNYSGSSPQYIFSGNNCWIYNSTIHDITDGGFVFYQGQQNFGAIGNSVYNCYDGIGVFCDNSTEAADYFGMIANNLVYSNRDSGIGITTGGTSPSLNQSYIHVTGNTLRNNNNGGSNGLGSIGVVGSQAVAIKGNFIANDGASATSGNTAYSITVDSASKFITIEDNVIGNVGSAAAPGIAIWTAGANYLTVKGNRFFDVNGTPTTYGIGGDVGAATVFENNLTMGPIKALFYLFTPAADTLINNQVTPQGAYGFSPLIQVMPPASTGNGIQIISEAPGNTPDISAVGSDADISIGLTPKGTGIVYTTAPVVGGNFGLQATGITWTGGAGAPTITQPKGSLFTRTDGGIGTTLYVSQGGGTWNAVAGV